MRDSMREQLRALGGTARAGRFWCDGKVKHKSRGAAEAHIRGLLRRELAAPGDLAPYKCVTCLTWHVGNVRDARGGR